MIELSLVVLAGLTIYYYVQATRERVRRLEAEQRVASLVSELERTAVEYRRVIGINEQGMHTH